MKKYAIKGLTNKSLNTVVGGKQFYTPVKGETKIIEASTIPQNLRQLEKNNSILIMEIK